MSGSATEHDFGVEFGLTGPAALEEQAQNGFHHRVGFAPQRGWDHQLGTEPAVLVRYGAAWPREFVRARVRPWVEVGIGTLWIGAAGGLAVPAGAVHGPSGLFYSEAEPRQEWVARDLFLDGNTFRQSVRVEKRSWVTGAVVGVGYGFARWSVELPLRRPRPRGRRAARAARLRLADGEMA